VTLEYDSAYKEFDAPLTQQLRREAYGDDIGQHSWVAADEVRQDIAHLALTPTSRLLDLGCGPCGPLTFILSTVGCTGTGIELSTAALEVGMARATSVGVAARLIVQCGDLNEPLPFDAESYDAAMSLDVVLHLRDRGALFREVARILQPGGRFLFTDAGVLTGAISADEVKRRSPHGFTQFVAPGWNERLLAAAGFAVLATEDRTPSVLKNAGGRLAALHAHRTALEQASSADDVAGQAEYLETVIDLSRRGAISRLMFLAQR